MAEPQRVDSDGLEGWIWAHTQAANYFVLVSRAWTKVLVENQLHTTEANQQVYEHIPMYNVCPGAGSGTITRKLLEPGVFFFFFFPEWFIHLHWNDYAVGQEGISVPLINMADLFLICAL